MWSAGAQALSRRFGTVDVDRWLLGLPVIIAAGAHVFATPGWAEIGDDAIIEQIASGEAYGEPSPHLVFPNLFVGWMIHALYRMAPGQSWYYWHHVSAVAIAHIALVCVLLRADRAGRPARDRAETQGTQGEQGVGRRLALFAVPLALLSQLWFTISLQFTQVAALVAFAGAALLVGPLLDSAKPLRLAPLGAAFALLFWGYSIRSASALMVVALMLPYLALRTLRDRTLWPIAIPPLAVIAGTLVNRVGYAGNDGWLNYRAFNQARGQIHATPVARMMVQSDGLREAIGYSVNDARVFNRWMYFDPQVFTTESLRKAHDVGTEQLSARASFFGRFEFADFGDHFSNESILQFTLAYGLLLVGYALAVFRRRWLVLSAPLMWSGSAVLLASVAYSQRLPLRVLHPAVFVVILGSIIAILVFATHPARPDADATVGTGSAQNPAIQSGPGRIAGWLTGVGVVGFCLFALTAIGHRSALNADGIDVYRARIDEINRALAELPDSGLTELVIVDTQVIPWAQGDPRGNSSKLSTPRLVSTWTMLSPQWNAALGTMHDNAYRAIADDPAVVLIATQRSFEVFVEFGSEHYGEMAPMRAHRPSGAVGWLVATSTLQGSVADDASTATLQVGAQSPVTVPVSTRLSSSRSRGPDAECVDSRNIMAFADSELVAVAPNLLSETCGTILDNSWFDHVLLTYSADNFGRPVAASRLDFETRDTLVKIRSAGKASGTPPTVAVSTRLDDGCATIEPGSSLPFEVSAVATIVIRATPGADIQLELASTDEVFTATIDRRQLAHEFTPGTVTLEFLGAIVPSRAALSISDATEPISVCGLR